MITIQISDDPLELVSLDEAKEHSRITDSDDDDVVQGKLDAAHDMIQQWLRRKLQPTTVVGVEENYSPEIMLPFPPITAINSIDAEDANGDLVTIPVEDYKFDDVIGSVRIKTSYKQHSRFRINFTCGYPVGKCPKAVQHGIKMAFATLYEYREDSVVGTQINDVPITARNIIKSFRVRSTK